VYWVSNDNNDIPRPVRPSDFLVILTGFVHNLAQTFEAMTSELMELSIYHSNQKTKTIRAWEDMTADLEKLGEETDG
jgi:hypothetical protein